MANPRLLVIAATALILLPLEATAVPAPFFGQPDVQIDLRQPNGDPISLDDDTFERILSDLRKLPALFETDIMPNLRGVIFENRDQLLHRYVHYVSVQHDMDGAMRIEVVAQPDVFPDQAIEIEQNVSASIDVLRYVQILMPLNVNITTPETLKSVLDKAEEYNSARIEALSNHAIERLVANREKLQHLTPTGEQASPNDDNTGAVIGLIVLKMIDNDLARTTVFYPTDQEGHQLVALDDVKMNVAWIQAPEFPVGGIAIGTALSIGVISALIMKRSGIGSARS